jgi:hypothetical protein
MDQHSGIVGNCVALRNFRSFVALHVWAVIAAFIHGVFCAVEGVFDSYRTVGRLLGAISGLISLMIAFQVGRAAVRLIRRVFDNQTTLEDKGNERLAYDLGRSANFAQFFGSVLGVLWPGPNDALAGFEWALPEYQSRARPERVGVVQGLA